MSIKDSKIVMICESNSKFTINKEGKDYILEGIFAELGVENGNGRIYEEKEYLPHLEYLQKRIKKGNLIGELDHPEKFDISLQKVSHMIEELNYNADKRQVIGKIRLLNTDAGKNAKAMIDDGVCLSISSRAAGVVKENKKVQLKKIFTYDLVAEPGFESAQLNLMNDSLGLSNDADLRVYEMTNISSNMLPWLTEDDIMDQNIIETLNLGNKNNLDMMTENQTNTNSGEIVTVAQMDKYSKVISSKIDSLEKSLIEKTNELSNMQELLEKHKAFSNYLAEQIDDRDKYIQNVIEYSDYVATHTDNLIEFTNSIVERTNQIQEYSDYLTENLDNTITETQNIIKFTDYIGEKTDLSIQYSEHVAENLQNLGEYSEYIAENVDNTIGFANYVSENLNSTINYAETIALTVNEGISPTKNELNESLNTGSETLSTKIDTILESIKKQNAEQTSKQVGFFGFNLLGEAKQREFALLENDQKQRIIKAANEAKPITTEHFLQIWENALNPTTLEKVLENVIAEMPTEYKSVWEHLDENSKYIILEQAQLYKLQTPYQIKDFWQTRAALNEAVSLQKLNEEFTADKLVGEQQGQKLIENVVTNAFGGFASYNNTHVANIGNILSRKY